LGIFLLTPTVMAHCWLRQAHNFILNFAGICGQDVDGQQDPGVSRCVR